MTNEFKGLRHYIDIVEAKEQSIDEAGIMNALGQLGGAVTGTVANGVNAVGNAVGGAYDAAKQGVTGAVDAAGKAIAGAVDPLVQGAKQGYASATGQPAPQQSASPTQKPAATQAKPAAKPAGAKMDPAVQKIQQDLIAKGAKIKADGIMGPATQAAMKQFGAAPGAPAAAVDTAPVPASANASSSYTGQAAPAAPAASNATANTTGGPANMGAPAVAPQTSMSTDDEAGAQQFDPTWGGTKAAADTRTGMEKVLPNFLGGKSAPQAANKNATWNNAQQAAVSNKPASVEESVGFQNEELQRIISLVHHR
jgi:hypothetical protein